MLAQLLPKALKRFVAIVPETLAFASTVKGRRLRRDAIRLPRGRPSVSLLSNPDWHTALLARQLSPF